MPSEFGPEEKREIVEAYKELGSINKADDELDYARSTISKYVNKWKDGDLEVEMVKEDEEEAEKLPDPPGKTAPDGFTADPPPNTAEEIEEGRPDFDEMSPGDFVKWFFDQDGFGVRANFVNRLASQCDVRDELPDQNVMVNNIVEGNSGVSNTFDARMIAESYEAALRNYRRSNGQSTNTDSPRPRGSWVGDDGQIDDQRDGARSDGSWVGAGDGGGGGGNGGGRARTDGSHERQRGGRGGRGGGQQNGGGSNPEVEKLAESVNELKQAQMRMMRQMQQGQSRNSGEEKGPQSFKKQAEELAEAHNALENFLGGDDDSGGDERVEALQEELRQMRQQLQEAQAAEGGGGADSEMGMIAEMAMQENVDPEKLRVFMEAMGPTDPEVKKAEYEFKRTERKLENRKELMDNFFDNLGEASGDVLGSLIGSLTDNGDGGQEQQQQQQGRQPDVARDGSEGDLQVVGENTPSSGGVQPEPPATGGDGDISPAREKHRDALDEIGGEREFRGPGDDDEAAGGGCEWVDEDGDLCGEPTDEGASFCSEHANGAVGEFQ